MTTGTITSTTIPPATTTLSRGCANPICKKQGTRKCSRCRTAMYCGEECQGADWKRHKVICKSPAKESSKSQEDSKLKKGEDKKLKQEPSSTASYASDPGFNLILKLCKESSFPLGLIQARKYAAEGKMVEAANCIAFMNKTQQDIFLEEMANNPKWKTVDVAIQIALAGRMDKATKMMKGISASEADIKRFLKGIVAITGTLLTKLESIVIAD